MGILTEVWNDNIFVLKWEHNAFQWNSCHFWNLFEDQFSVKVLFTQTSANLAYQL